MRVYVATPLRSYTGRAAEVEAEGATLRELLGDLDRRHPGIRVRMIDEQDRVRPHIRFFFDSRPATTLDAPAPPGAVLHVICAISGGSGAPCGA